MRRKIDENDRLILNVLQADASLSMDELSERVGLSRNACWRRVKAMEADGTIVGRVTLVDPEAVGCPLTAMVLVRTSGHNSEWLAQFQAVIRRIPEITGAYRMSGELDYILRVRVPDVAAYDAFYKRLTAEISVSNISASFVMEEIKHTTALPLSV